MDERRKGGVCRLEAFILCQTLIQAQKMSRYDSEREWRLIKPLLPNKPNQAAARWIPNDERLQGIAGHHARVPPN
jgi:hypothetical protein